MERQKSILAVYCGSRRSRGVRHGPIEKQIHKCPVTKCFGTDPAAASRATAGDGVPGRILRKSLHWHSKPAAICPGIHVKRA